MFDGAFFFTGRIGRLAFFVNSLVAGPIAAIAMALVAFLPMPWRAKVPLLFMIGIAFGWFYLSLHVRRIRDIGWDPFIVIVGAFAVAFGDVILAHAVPAFSINGYSTPLGSLSNLAFSLALLFWPGEEIPTYRDRQYGFG